ncbi:MAG: DUF4250 domain-containing protein [Clostridia bacterium]|nr:DUF4250 domain-containing protein [Clostridia bacterium]MDE7306531.1 DUF4250 domain-containing protein [Clostridia bacterium]
MNLPADDYILLSLVNTKLRDEYPSLQSLCDGEEIDGEELCARLASAGYVYDGGRNAFVIK